MSKLELQVAAWAPRVLSILRIMAALVFIQHGTQKLFNFPESTRPVSPDGISTFMLITGLLEFGGGGLFLLGLFTRPVAFMLSGMMAVAYFMAHAPRGFYPINNGGDLAILFSFVFLYFMCAGGGCWSLDAQRTKKSP